MAVTDLTYVEVERRTDLSIRAFGWALFAVLAVLFVLCDLVALVWPGIAATHAWVELFTLAPAGSLRSFVEGIFWSFVFGWIAGIVFGVTYNRIAGSAGARS